MDKLRPKQACRLVAPELIGRELLEEKKLAQNVYQ